MPTRCITSSPGSYCTRTSTFSIFTFSKTVTCISFSQALVTFAAQGVPPCPCTHRAIQDTLGQKEEYSNGSKGQSTEQEKPTEKKVIHVVEIDTEEEECYEETH